MKTRKITWLLPFLAAFFLLTSSCDDLDGPRVRGIGPTESETRSVNSFSRIDLETDADVILTQGSSQQVRVEAQRNILNVLKTEVNGDELRIDFDRVNILGHDPIKVYITVPALTQVRVSGSSHVWSTTPWTAASCAIDLAGSGRVELPFAQATGLRTTISGSGEVRLSGTAQNHNITISGSGQVAAYDLAAQDTHVSISGSGRSYVHTARTLSTDISGSGSVHYKGNPTVSTRISGSGRVLAE